MAAKQVKETAAVNLLTTLDLDLNLPEDALITDVVVITRYLDGDKLGLAVGGNSGIDWLTRYAMTAYAYDVLERE